MHCPQCDREVLQPSPGELLGSYIGPAAKATAIYLRYQLNVSDRKISQFFADFFGLKFVPASAYGFERQAVRRGLPLYADLLEKVRSLAVAHADETSWRHDGHPYWVWYAGDDDLAVFLWQAHRSTEAAQALLGERFGGVLVADAFASYNRVIAAVIADPNIDHRRVLNLMTYFTRKDYARPLSDTAADYLPGDIVAWDLGSGITHIGIVSNRNTSRKIPLIIHNIGAGTLEEDILFQSTIIGHYRISNDSKTRSN